MSQQYERDFYIPKHKLTIGLVLFGVSVLFLALCVAYLYSRSRTTFVRLPIPTLFYVNALFLIGSSYCFIKGLRSFRAQEYRRTIHLLKGAGAATLLFLIVQVIAWKQLFDAMPDYGSNQSLSFLYVISFLHFLHVVAGLPFLAVFLKKISSKSALHGTSSSPPIPLGMLWNMNVYWHFLDIMWIFLLIFFFVNNQLSS